MKKNLIIKITKKICRLWREINTSSKSVSWSEQGVKTLCIKIGYSEPTRAESREGSPPRAESSRVTYWRLGLRNTRFWLADDSGDVILDSDWLPRVLPSRQCIKIWSRGCCRDESGKIWSREPTQCIKIGDACIKIWNRVFFGTVRQFSADFSKKNFGCPLPPARIIITPADN